MSDKIIYIPLDSRPPNTDFVYSFAKMANLNILVPPEEYIGKFLNPGNPKLLREWIVEQDADVLILSLDMLVYGGLVASRDFNKVNLETAMKNLKFLKIYKQMKPKVKIYAFGTIMRLSISVRDEATVRWWDQLNKYNELIYLIDVLGEVKYKKELNKLLLNIPNKIIRDHALARKRNHKINLAEINLVNDGIIDYLILAQEDCSVYGIHLIEQKEILKKIDVCSLQEKVNLFDGADEVGQVLLARYFNELYGYSPKIFVEYDSYIGRDNIPKYEGIPVYKNIEQHIKSAGGRITQRENEADFVLAVTTPFNPQLETYELPLNIPCKNKEVLPFAEMLNEYCESGHRVFLCDLTYSNGGNPFLMSYLIENKILFNLTGYYGWNTAGNSIGSSVAHGSILSVLNFNNSLNYENINSSFTMFVERIIDDYLYQSIIRKLTDDYCRHIGMNVYSMPEKNKKIENFIYCYLERMVPGILYSYEFRHMGKSIKIDEIEFDLELPWDRLFEIKLTIKLRKKASK